MAIQNTINDVFSSEIKQGLSARYFTFRKLIEEDEMDFKEKIRQYSILLQKRISFDLIRIYILLGNEERINGFMELAGLDQKLFFEPNLIESAVIGARVFRCQKFSGLTREKRFINFLLECYKNLYSHTEVYLKHIDELEEDRAVIVEEIKEFYRENDLSSIVGFLQGLGAEEGNSGMQGPPEVGLADELVKKMKIPPLPPIEKTLTILPHLADPGGIKHELKKLAKTAYRDQQPEILKMFDQKEPACDRLGVEN